MSKGYIYLRENEYWNSYNIYKLGKTQCIPNRESTYKTSEINIDSMGNKKAYFLLDANREPPNKAIAL